VGGWVELSQQSARAPIGAAPIAYFSIFFFFFSIFWVQGEA
jgi:hypothetical protein